MAPVGHTASQSAHQSQIAVSTIATTGSSTSIRPPGSQTLTHNPQPLHLLWSISGNIAIAYFYRITARRFFPTSQHYYKPGIFKMHFFASRDVSRYNIIKYAAT
jgi:hypothetical protein